MRRKSSTHSSQVVYAPAGLMTPQDPGLGVRRTSDGANHCDGKKMVPKLRVKRRTGDGGRGNLIGQRRLRVHKSFHLLFRVHTYLLIYFWSVLLVFSSRL
ncbi:hypothetical protein GALMADRAFT_596603 [Galerina marginata CBS 339.88]|uniref:Uncharacterized protein n=1 Tax=Galerina marginata (strain CBS 339.88) TaxID=685588 RepID=A0A067SVD1_GALM3|nr:hypothetical protein GALMADRAFT_596603 [Galerina marginata CBS 339.88]